MKYLVLSDIHGSVTNLKEVLKKEIFDKIILLGDILPHGPRNNLPIDYNPKEVIDILNNYKDIILCIKGNCDAEVDEMVLKFPLLSLICLDINNTNIYFTHGHIYNPSNPLNINKGIVIFGHTHIKEITHINNVIYINPGSLGIPKDNSASYILIDKNIIYIKDMNNNILERINLCRN